MSERQRPAQPSPVVRAAAEALGGRVDAGAMFVQGAWWSDGSCLLRLFDGRGSEDERTCWTARWGSWSAPAPAAQDGEADSADGAAGEWVWGVTRLKRGRRQPPHMLRARAEEYAAGHHTPAVIVPPAARAIPGPWRAVCFAASDAEADPDRHTWVQTAYAMLLWTHTGAERWTLTRVPVPGHEAHPELPKEAELLCAWRQDRLVGAVMPLAPEGPPPSAPRMN